ncbi:MAG: hypothetical protein HY784_14955 [Chloroflexi bacterium]|nr:hypothetical protein [Chloroflexota bacterium]
MDQLPLFSLQIRLSQAFAVAPDLWPAAEAFVAGTLEERAAGLARLTTAGRAGYTRLHLHLFASRLHEPDLPLRHAIIEALGATLDRRDGPPPQDLRETLFRLLACFGSDQIEWIVEALARVPGAHLAAARLLAYTPGAGQELARLAADLRKGAEERAAAAIMIGEVGYVDAIPALEGLEARLEGRRAGQLAMSFAPPREDPAADLLLPAVKAALEVLREVD